LDLLEGTETAGFFVNATFIRVLAQQAWDDMPANRRLNGDGVPDPNGPIHLTNLTVTLEAPDAVVTRIDGVDTRPWPDVNFTITITDQIAAKLLLLTCKSDSKLDADTGWFVFLDFVFGIASLVSPWFALGFAIFFFEAVAVAGASAPQESGVGCAVLQLLPPRIPIAGGQDVLFFYDRATVTTGGLFVGAVIDQMARTPSSSIVGPSQLAANISDGSVGGTFQAFGDDVRGNLTYVWGGDGEVLSPGLQATMIVFAIGGANVGTFMTKNITVSITDEEWTHGLGRGYGRDTRHGYERHDNPPDLSSEAVAPDLRTPRLTHGSKVTCYGGTPGLCAMPGPGDMDVLQGQFFSAMRCPGVASFV